MLKEKSFVLLVLVLVSEVLGFLWLKKRYRLQSRLTVDEKMARQMDTLDEQARKLYPATLPN